MALVSATSVIALNIFEIMISTLLCENSQKVNTRLKKFDLNFMLSSFTCT